jgi:hypothetical protein
VQVSKKLLAGGKVLYRILYRVAYLFFGGVFPERSVNGTRIRVTSSGTTYVDSTEAWRNMQKARRAQAAKTETNTANLNRRSGQEP